MITKETFNAAPGWTVFRGEAADPGPIFWGLFDINPSDYEFVEDPNHDLEALSVDFIEPELDSEYRSEQPAGADDLDAALAYLRRGGALCKVPDAPGSRYFRLLVVGEPVSTHDFKIEAHTAAGPISWHPYPSHAAAQADLPRVKQQARMLGVLRGSWQILPIHGSVATVPGATTLALARALEGRRLRVGQWTAKLLVATYDSGEVAIELVDVGDDETIAALTVNSGGRARLGPGEILVKTWGDADVVLGPALASGYFEDTGRRVQLGFAEAAVWRIRPRTAMPRAGAQPSAPQARTLTPAQRKLVAKAFVDYQAINADRFARKIRMHLGTPLPPHQPPLSADEAAALGARFRAKADTADDRAAAVLLFALPFGLPASMTERQTDALLAALAPSADLSKLPSTNRAIRELGKVMERIRRRPTQPIPKHRAPKERAPRGRSR